MAGAGLRAGKAVIELTLLTKGVEAGLRKVEAKAKAVGAKLARIGTGGMAGGGGGGGGGGFGGMTTLLTGAAAATAALWPAKLAANIELASAQMEVFTGSSETAKATMLDLTKFAARSGQSLESMTTQMRVLMSREIAAPQAMQSIKAIATIAGGSVDEFEQLTKAFADVARIGRLTGEEMRQFKNTAFNPLIGIAKKTGESQEELDKRMKAGGVGIEEVAAAMQAAVREGGLFHGMLDKIAGTFTGSFNVALGQLGVALLPIGEQMIAPFTALFEAINGAMPAITAFIARNAGIVRIVLSVVAAIAGAAAGFLALAIAFKLLAIAAGGAATVLGLITTLLTTSIGLPVLLGAAFAGLIVYFLTTTEAGKAMVNKLMGYFGQLLGTAKTTFGGISNALKAGDMKLAAEIAWVGIKLAFLQGTESIMGVWRNFKDLFVRTVIELVFEAQKHFTNLTSFVKSTWQGLVTHSKSIGEQVGHWLTRSDDPQLAAEQDRQSNMAVERFRQEGQAKIDAIERERLAAIGAIEGSKGEAHAYQSDSFNEEVDAAAKEMAELKRQLADLNASAYIKAKNVIKEDPFAEKALEFAKVGTAMTAKKGQALKTEAFLDPRMIHQLAGARGIDEEQLDELHRIRMAAERNERQGGLAFG